MKSSGFRKLWGVIEKELRLQWRSRQAAGALLLFALTTLSAVSMVLGGRSLEPDLLAVLFWIVLFFSAMAGLPRVFLDEDSYGTIAALRIYAGAQPVLLGKCIYNFLLLLLLSLVLLPLFSVFLQAEIFQPGSLVVVLLLGSAGLAVVTTLAASLILPARSQGTLFTIISFPLLLPVLLPCIQLTAAALQASVPLPGQMIGFLAAYDAVMLGIASILFDFIWYD